MESDWFNCLHGWIAVCDPVRADGDDFQLGIPVDDQSSAFLSVGADQLDIFISGVW